MSRDGPVKRTEKGDDKTQEDNPDIGKSRQKGLKGYSTSVA